MATDSPTRILHDLAQPLNIIRLAADGALLMMERSKADPTYQAQQFALISQQCEAMAQLLAESGPSLRRLAAPPSPPVHILLVGVDATALTGLSGPGRCLYHVHTIEDAGLIFDDIAQDIVIIDMETSGPGVSSLVERLRDFDPLLPLILVNTDTAAARRVFPQKMDDRCAVLTKPIPIEVLRDCLTTFLQPPGE